MTRNITKKETAITKKVLLEKYRTLYIAIHNHRTHKNNRITFKDYPYLFEMYKDQSRFQVDKKSTQSGITELLLCKSISRSSLGKSIFYVLPKMELKGTFVQDRFNKTVDNTIWYKKLKRYEGKRMAENITLKHIGKGSIFFASSNSSSNFISYPADDVIIDEVDECNQQNLKMAIERQSASTDPMDHRVGNPTIEDYGIDAEYKRSDKKKWYAFCLHCQRLNQPQWFKHVLKEVEENEYIVRDPEWERFSKNDIRLICEHCGKPFERYGPGIWIPEKKSNVSGRHINKLFSSRMRIDTMLDRFERGLVNAEDMQRFWNGDMGEAFTMAGSKITIDILEKCCEDYFMPKELPKNARAVMGIDVGNYLHVKINHLLPDGRRRSVYIDTIPIVESAKAVDHAIMQIKSLWKLYNCICGVVDAQPEMRLSRALCHSIPGMFRWYDGSDKNNPVDINAKKVYYDRNLLLDELKADFVSNFIILPKNAKYIQPLNEKGISEYYDNITAPTRVLTEYGRNKIKKYVWKETRPDHYAFAEAYAHLARKIISSLRG